MSSKIGSAISKIQRLAGQGQADETGSLDVVFHVPGSLVSPDYDGVRTGTFWRKKRILQVQIAVPRDLSEKEEGEIGRSLVNLLRRAVHIAQPVFHEARVPFRHDHYERLLESIERAFSPN
jgi:hypothetical protein